MIPRMYRCPNCDESFIPKIEYEFPTRIVYWHKCPDGSIACVNVERPKRKWEFVKKTKPMTQKDVFNQRLRLVFGAMDNQRFDDKED